MLNFCCILVKAIKYTVWNEQAAFLIITFTDLDLITAAITPTAWVHKIGVKNIFKKNVFQFLFLPLSLFSVS